MLVSGFYGQTTGKKQRSRHNNATMSTMSTTPLTALHNNRVFAANRTTPSRRRGENDFEMYEPGMPLEAQPSPSQLNDTTGSDSDGPLVENDGLYLGSTSSPDCSASGIPTSHSLYARQDQLMPNTSFNTPVTNRNSSDYREIMTMLQQQQAAIKQVLDGQKVLEGRQNNFEQKILRLQTKFDMPSPCSSVDSGVDGKKKRIVTRSLSKKVYAVHEAMASAKKFKPNESSTSVHNKSVQAAILYQIMKQADCKFTEGATRMAVKRCYENLRRTYLEQQDEKAESSELQSKRRRYRSRRDRKFQRRSSVVSQNEMERYWKFLSLSYVTEESDDGDNPNGIIEPKLPWRSEKLDKFMEVLEQRFNVQQQKKPSGIVPKKVRKVGEPSESPPPLGAPLWAIKKEFHNMEINSLIKDLESREVGARSGRYMKRQRKLSTPSEQDPPEGAPSWSICQENYSLDGTPQGATGVGSTARRNIVHDL